MSLPTIEEVVETGLLAHDLPTVVIRKNIEDGKWKLQESRWRQDNGRGRVQSAAWNTFYGIKDENGVLVEKYVCCIYCKMVYKYTQEFGTSKLLKHQKSCLKKCVDKSKSCLEKGIEIEQPKENRYNTDLSPDDKLLLTKACSEFVIRDMRPLNALYGKGLHALLSAYTYTCTKYNGLDRNPIEYLPSHHTVARNVQLKSEVFITM